MVKLVLERLIRLYHLLYFYLIPIKIDYHIYSMSSQRSGDEGIILRAMTEIFKRIKEDTESEYVVKMSYVQIYMEMVCALHCKLLLLLCMVRAYTYKELDSRFIESRKQTAPD